MKWVDGHPDEATLALFSGGDLGWLAGWRVARHAARCEQCRAVLARFEQVREAVGSHADTPDVDFEALAHRVRVALDHERPAGARRPRWRTALAGAALAAAAVATLTLPRGDVAPAGSESAVGQPAPVGSPWATSAPPGLDAEVTSDGHLRIRAYHGGSGTMTITDYYAP